MENMTVEQLIAKMEEEAKSSATVVDLSKLQQSIDRLYELNAKKAVSDAQVAQILERVSRQLSAISVPAFPKSISVNNQADWTQQFSKLTKAIKDFEAMYHSHEMEKMKHHKSKEEEKYVRNEEKNHAKEKVEEVDLEDYRVADVLEPVSGYQYFGFVKPDGSWYILYNDGIEGRLRYKFGSVNYSAAWSEYDKQDYKLLDEAMNEIQG